VIGVLLGGGFFFVFMVLIARRSVRRMTTKAPILDAPLSEVRRAATRSILMERVVATGILVALTVALGNPALPGIAIGGGLGLLVTSRLTRRWQEQNHETLVVARRPHHILLPERPSYYRVRATSR
jgi:xanthosine utilization system XapX-like protein